MCGVNSTPMDGTACEVTVDNTCLKGVYTYIDCLVWVEIQGVSKRGTQKITWRLSTDFWIAKKAFS